MLSQGIEVLPDRYAVAMLVGAIILGRGRRFITDWSPFIGLLISYDFLRGFADDLAGRAEFVLPMQADTAIFGIVPTAFLQQTFFNSSSLQWYDYAATLLYSCISSCRWDSRWSCGSGAGANSPTSRPA